MKPFLVEHPVNSNLSISTGPQGQRWKLAALQIRALVLDVDGVLTDGGLYFGGEGDALKRFSVHDGLALSWLRQLGYKLGIVTGRTSPIVSQRAKDLNIDAVIHGELNKLAGLQKLAAQWNTPLEQIAYMGDDWPDAAALRNCGFAVTVASAPEPIRAHADFVVKTPAGHGAVREFIDWLLQVRGQWVELERLYLEPSLQISVKGMGQ